MKTKTYTILGCGVAGSWFAHQLLLSGINNFILFDGELRSDTEKLSLLPYYHYDGNEILSINLKKHLLSINPHAKVETHGFFDIANDGERLKGTVIGAIDASHSAPNMKGAGGCSGGNKAALSNGNDWFSFGISKLDKEKISFGVKPLLADEYFGGYPHGLSKLDLLRHSIKAVSACLES